MPELRYCTNKALHSIHIMLHPTSKRKNALNLLHYAVIHLKQEYIEEGSPFLEALLSVVNKLVNVDYHIKHFFNVILALPEHMV